MHMSTRLNGQLITNAEEYAKIRTAFIEHDRQLATGKPSSMKGKTFSAEVRALISQNTKVALADKEVRKKISIANSNREPWNKGLAMSSEQKQKLSAAHIGKKLTEEHKQHIGEAGRGRIVSEETKSKISKSQSGKNCKHNRAVYCIDTEQVFYNIKFAAETFQISSTNIVQVCKGKRNSVNGLHFLYYEDYLNLCSQKGVVND